MKKNIHILKTNKPSRLMLRHGILFFFKDDDSIPKGTAKNQNIYITSSEEIKEGDWILVPSTDGKTYFDFSKSVPKKAESNYDSNNFVFKIILTTDPSLAPDVQKIDDEFLEWFVKNPSCEEVEAIKTFEDYVMVGGKVDEIYYKIIIPKEEPKQETTLEEAMESYLDSPLPHSYKRAVKFGAKWQEEQDLSMVQGYLSANLQNIELLKRSYSEEEVKDLIEDWTKVSDGLNFNFPTSKFNKWFEQFKKK